jgi:sugar phosphate isomerase/epimerase
MKIGVKTYFDHKYIEHFKNKVDFIEIISLEKSKILRDKKIIVHCKHERFGINLADKTKEKENKEAVKFAIDIADFCNSERIIVHPGFIENENCSIKNTIDIIRGLGDKRIIFENMPSTHRDKKFTCSTPEELEKVLEECKTSFCLDINHAISAAIKQNLEPYEYIKKFMKLSPAQIHLGGQKLPEDITHLSFSRSNIDLKKVLNVLPKNSEIVLEVTQYIEETEKDLEIIRQIIGDLT